MTLDTLKFTVLLKRGITFGLIPFNRSPFFLAALRDALYVLGNLLLGKSKRMRERNEPMQHWDSVDES